MYGAVGSLCSFSVNKKRILISLNYGMDYCRRGALQCFKPGTARALNKVVVLSLCRAMVKNIARGLVGPLDRLYFLLGTPRIKACFDLSQPKVPNLLG